MNQLELKAIRKYRDTVNKKFYTNKDIKFLLEVENRLINK